MTRKASALHLRRDDHADGEDVKTSAADGRGIVDARPQRSGGYCLGASEVPVGAVAPDPVDSDPVDAGGEEEPAEGLLPVSVVAAFHSGIDFRSSADFVIRNAPLSASHLNSSTGSATWCAPIPTTPPALTTRRSIVRLSGCMRAVET